MKRILIILLMLSACTQTPEQKAKSAIKKFLEKTLNDPSSYEPVDFGKLDSMFLLADDGRKVFSGYTLVHSYRAKNGFNALVMTIDTFWYSPTIDYATNTWASKGK
jgi:hypothetical protein